MVNVMVETSSHEYNKYVVVLDWIYIYFILSLYFKNNGMSSTKKKILADL